jgi:hypothetical protein
MAYYPPYQPRTTIAPLLVEAHTRLLAEANAAMRNGQNEMAVVLAQVAAELCTEAAVSGLLRARSMNELTKPLLKLFVSYNICQDRLRDVYNALSGDTIQGQTQFWEKLCTHTKRRNAIVHEGKGCTRPEAEESCKAVGDYIAHVTSVTSKPASQV